MPAEAPDEKRAASSVHVEPYIPAGTHLPEFTPRALILGTILGMVFGASSLYLVLKVGLTVSASIPVAVISLTLFRLGSRVVGFPDATILENNIAQTAGSAGESIAFGVGVTMPSIMILGFDLELTRVMLVAILGGALGILMMIPLRRALIVKEHGALKYPEGTACAEVLKAGASEESKAAASALAKAEAQAVAAAGLARSTRAHTIFSGFGIGLAYKTLMAALKLWKDTPEKVFAAPFKAGSVGMEISPELLGVGYIIGPRIASIMCAGGVLAYLVLIPLIKFFGEGVSVVLPPGGKLIRDMSPNDIRSAYILYIGAGAVAAGGVISLIRSLPTIWHGLKAGLSDFGLGRGNRGNNIPRTERDLSMRFVGVGIVALLAAITLARPLHMNLLGALLILVFGFLFVTVSSRLTGEIGSSSNPISGMTVATLLLTCLVFLLVGWTGNVYYVTALSVGGIVCIASSNGGTTSQDLKTGFLVGSTPRLQQIAILIGALASALVLGPILKGLNDVKTVYVPADKVAPGLQVTLPNVGVTKREKLLGPQGLEDTKTHWVYHQLDPAGGAAKKFLLDDTGKALWYVDPGINGTFEQRPDGSRVEKFSAPKAVLMSYIIKGILDRKLPWALVLFGVMIAITLELSSIPSLAFAVGVYLPLASSAPLFIGGLVRLFVDRRQRARFKDTSLSEAQLAAESDKSPGVLLSSGYIAGGAITGIIVAFMEGVFPVRTKAIDEWSQGHNPFYSTADWNGLRADWLALIPFIVLCCYLYRIGRDVGGPANRKNI
ncbi:MAG: oligopeptide transporter, OPT family [Verrucomicrobia bacterium]|nr:MAG: oligopeptide transporter, OPT family [Verrucomicrobiota bacterium]